MAEGREKDARGPRLPRENRTILNRQIWIPLESSEPQRFATEIHHSPCFLSWGTETTIWTAHTSFKTPDSQLLDLFYHQEFSCETFPDYSDFVILGVNGGELPNMLQDIPSDVSRETR